MLKNYIKIAWRNLWKHKLFSLINIISLSIGLSASFVIGMMVYYEYTFDTFHPDRERIYRVVTDIETPQGTNYYGGVTAPLRTAVKDQMTGVEASVYFYMWYVSTAKTAINERLFRNPDRLILTNTQYFELFQYEWLAGNAQGVLTQPNQVVLTASKAKDYFPSLSPTEVIGQEIIYNDNIPVVVQGVVADFSARTDIIFDEFVSLETARQVDVGEQIFTESWGNTHTSSQLFIKIAKDTPVGTIKSQLDQLALTYTDQYRIKFDQVRHFGLLALSDIHFDQNYGVYNYDRIQASKEVLWGLGFVALFLLILGSINFINLNTAQAAQRAKEIGVRKTLGGSKKQLIGQFMTETYLITFMAALLSLGMSLWLINVFDAFIPSGLTSALMLQPQMIVYAVVLLVVVATLSGLYPSLVLSHFKPARVLKGDTLLSNRSSSMRKVLTVFQFSIAQIFIIATLLVGKQIHFLLQKDMGFDAETTAYVATPWDDDSIAKRQVLAQKISSIPEIRKSSLGSMPPASFSMTSGLASRITDGGEVKQQIQFLFGDRNYYNTYDLELIAGRTPLNDTIREYVINQTALSVYGFDRPEEAIGAQLTFTDGDWSVVGVVKDFNQHSLHSSVSPMAITGDFGRPEFTQFRNIHLSLPQDKDQLSAAISKIETAFTSVYPEAIFELQFTDQMVANFYQNEQRIATLLNWATGLAVLISCLGLLGLVIHTTERRTKEIGIRKVLGASIVQLNMLLCKEFLLLVAIAFIIAAPLAFLGLQDWLQDFAYKTALSWWVFALSGLVMVCIALAIMSIRTIATAMRNPVTSLRTD